MPEEKLLLTFGHDEPRGKQAIISKDKGNSLMISAPKPRIQG
jgi:hypothetical protein